MANAYNVHAGYRGIMDFPSGGQSNYVRFTDCSIAAKQDVNIPDLVMGHWDKDSYNYQKVEVNGSMSGPIDENFGSVLWQYAAPRSGCGLLTAANPHLYYYCDETGRDVVFNGMIVNSLTVSCAAGDVAQFSAEFIGKTAGAYTTNSAPIFSNTAKLITWDKLSVSITATTDAVPQTPTVIAYQNFSVTIANNAEPVYAILSSGSSNLFPYEVIPGIRTITGSITGFDIDAAFSGFNKWDDYATTGAGTLTFTLGSLSVPIKARFHRINPTLGVGPVTSTIAFSGVGAQSF